MRVRRRLRFFGISMVILLASSTHPGPAAAHDVTITSMARVFIDHVGENRYVLSALDTGLPSWDGDAIANMLPERCAPTADWQPGRTSQAPPTLSFECASPLGPSDEILLPWDLSGIVVVFRSIDRVDTSAYFEGRGRSVGVRLGDLGVGTTSRLRVVTRYTALGAEHILLGIDHLLFVLGLLLLVRGIGPLVATITAFTLAHSLTLASAVLGWTSVDGGAVEAAIALSIVLLAREVVMGQRGAESLVHRRPWLVAFGFGLLHGFGFAGALAEIGLGGADVPSALLSFNIGVELGQLAFVAVLVGVNAVSRAVLSAHLHRLRPLVGYALGAVATFWFFDRLPGLFGA